MVVLSALVRLESVDCDGHAFFFSDDGMLELEILHVFPFDSVRKRMSVILLHPLTHQRVLFCKGADSSVFPRLRPAIDPKEVRVVEETQRNLHGYARLGLRVLVMAKRVLSEEEYTEWVEEHKVAEVRVALPSVRSKA